MQEKIYSILFLLTFLLLSVKSQNLVEVDLGYSNTSVNTAIFRYNALTTHKNIQFIAFYDSEEYLVLGKRKINSDKWELKRSQYKGNCSDAHNIISIMVDGDGYIHVSFDHHGHPLNYCRSKEPLSLELGELTPMLNNDENNVTYPEFYKLTNGDLIFVYRSGSSGRGNLVMNRYHLAQKKWERIHDILIDGEDQRNAYWQICLDEEDHIHLSWVWRESWLVETNHDLCYARSKDGGKTWENSKGKLYKLPINASNAEYIAHIPQNSELINQTSMTTDEFGNPYIATYWRSKDSKTPQYRLVWSDGNQWKINQVSERKTPFSLSGGGTKRIPISRPKLVVKNKQGTILCHYIIRDVERNDKVSIYTTNNLKSNQWEIKDYTFFSVEAWEPNLDTELWKLDKKLHLFVQRNGQGDGEKKKQLAPQPIYVLEVN